VQLITGLTWELSSWNYLMDGVISVQFDTGLAWVISSLEIFDG
jgi:hypothetical protein